MRAPFAAEAGIIEEEPVTLRKPSGARWLEPVIPRLAEEMEADDPRRNDSTTLKVAVVVVIPSLLFSTTVLSCILSIALSALAFS